jgi:hypothetical protein
MLNSKRPTNVFVRVWRRMECVREKREFFSLSSSQGREKKLTLPWLGACEKWGTTLPVCATLMSDIVSGSM